LPNFFVGKSSLYTQHIDKQNPSVQNASSYEPLNDVFQRTIFRILPTGSRIAYHLKYDASYGDVTKQYTNIPFRKYGKLEAHPSEQSFCEFSRPALNRNFFRIRHAHIEMVFRPDDV
jgi:hypothetical protein